MTTFRTDSLLISGIQARTTNAEEKEGKGKLGKLWADFASKLQPHIAQSKVYAVYYDYESDVTGAYSVLLGCESSSLTNSSIRNLAEVEIQTGKYRQFSASGSMPETTIRLWQEVWQFYQRNEVKRAYTTDYELYSSPEQVSIFIAEK